MPATGVRAPARMFVAVRAIAPVAGSPPTSGDTMLARPCATSSVFESWRSPLSLSATIADISDSMAPSIADRHRRRQQAGNQRRAKAGNATGASQPDGMPPNLEPIGLDRQLQGPTAPSSARPAPRIDAGQARSAAGAAAKMMRERS